MGQAKLMVIFTFWVSTLPRGYCPEGIGILSLAGTKKDYQFMAQLSKEQIYPLIETW